MVQSWQNDSLTNLDVVTTGTITKASRISSGTLADTVCYKKGNVVVVSGRIHSMSPSVASTGQYFQIPVGFRPSTRIFAFGVLNIDNNIGFIPSLSEIRADGSVYLGYSNSATANQASFYATYTV